MPKQKRLLYQARAGKAFGAYGPFTQTYRLNFSSFKKPGDIIYRQVVPNRLNLRLEMMYIKELLIFVYVICASNVPASILF